MHIGCLKQLRAEIPPGRVSPKVSKVDCRVTFSQAIDPSLARDVHADLIITTSSYLRFLTRIFNLDKAARFVRQTPCPVLVYQATDT